MFAYIDVRGPHPVLIAHGNIAVELPGADRSITVLQAYERYPEARAALGSAFATDHAPEAIAASERFKE